MISTLSVWLLCRANNKKSRLCTERGASTVVLSIAVLALLLLFASFALNAARYYNFKKQLKVLSAQIATFSGTYLPNPALAYQHAQEAFQTFTLDPITGVSRFPADLKMTVLLETAGTEITYSGSPTQAKLPIGSMSIKLDASFSMTLLYNPAPAAGLSVIKASASSRVQLTPTDVVLVIENSNSLISPLEEGEGTSITTALNAPFGMWKDDLVGMPPSYGAIHNQISKQILRARQCFGQAVKEQKRAAILMYDLLTSSDTFRVGVVQTLQRQSEFPGATVAITTDSYKKAYVRQSVDVAAPDAGALFTAKDPNHEYGMFEYEDSRCAALTSLYPVPQHPLRGTIDAGFTASNFQFNLTSQLNCLGNFSACPNLTHLTFNSALAPKLLPRELLWIGTSGVEFEHGLPDSKYDYVHAQFALLRALDMLKQAPQREDKLPVRRRVILYFTDGFEKMYSVESGARQFGDDRTFNRIPEVVNGGSGFSTQNLGFDPNSANAALFENYCLDKNTSSTLVNPLYTETQALMNAPSSNDVGVKLGILYNAFRGPYVDLDPLSFYRKLLGHDYADPSTKEFRKACNSRWSFERGRFIAEASPLTFSTGGGKNFYEQVVPKIARTLFSAELVE